MAARLKSFRTWQFKMMQKDLPAEVQRQCDSAFERFQENPWHPSLYFGRLDEREPPRYGCRVGARYRAVGRLQGDTIIWVWVGSHEAFNKAFAEGRKHKS